ncbi:AraC family transcriptional regulator [Jiangella anatolica]|uniref:AraC family transcriptional regulator n=1 Tax=Jiangella anatolica TaxID=2670374 RepID=A0A2W2AYJ4_9ACTN|nr:AraC family transcriptional regulator [Jiangella anatolica]PZF80301.1 AraC family transcriptional regulator [Jiangella anatolica]
MDELRELIRRHTRHAPGEVPIGESAVISAISSAGPPEFSMTGTLAVLLVQGAKRLAVGDQVYTYRAGQSLVTSVDLPTTGHFIGASRETPALGFALTLRPALIAELLLHPAAAALPRATGATPPAVMVGDAGDDLVEAVTRMVRLLDRPRDLPVLAPLVERELTWLLLRGPHGASVGQLGLAGSRLNRVAHAVRFLRERYADPVRVDELARMARLSPSAFHRSFQAVTSLSPIQFQKQLRLQEARVRVLADHGDIAGIAHAVGYESPSQFSRDYKRRFGASPRHDAQRFHATAVTPDAGARR